MAQSTNNSQLQQELHKFISHDLSDFVRQQVDQQVKAILSKIVSPTVSPSGETTLVLSSQQANESHCAPFQRGTTKNPLSIAFSYLDWSDYFSCVKTCALWNRCAKDPVSRDGATITLTTACDKMGDYYILVHQLSRHTHLWRLAGKVSLKVPSLPSIPDVVRTKFCAMISSENVRRLEIVMEDDECQLDDLVPWIKNLIPHLREIRTNVDIPRLVEIINDAGCSPNLTSVSEGLYVESVSKNKITKIFSDKRGWDDQTVNTLLSDHLGNSSSSLWNSVQLLDVGAIQTSATSLLDLILFAPHLEELKISTLFISDLENGMEYLASLPMATTRNTTLQSICLGDTRSMRFHQYRSNRVISLVHECIKRFHVRLFHVCFIGLFSERQWTDPNIFDTTIISLTMGLKDSGEEYSETFLQVIDPLSRMKQLEKLTLRCEVSSYGNARNWAESLRCLAASYMMPSLKSLNVSIASHFSNDTSGFCVIEFVPDVIDALRHSQLEHVTFDLLSLGYNDCQERDRFEQFTQHFYSIKPKSLKKARILLPPMNYAGDENCTKLHARTLVQSTDGWSVDRDLIEFNWKRIPC